ncbi:hypothetical protein TREMEDRAFT_59400 [Tremella mesenterica DSM 1558]|uniref:uncharacterized protein n=1 Tax=Tremella mesenterica (strain ATCC 24925 / CBS 8224 / DSM 1558 / NBRC 9311 / NRRL Y-6157 / RJB 2259-6 / UBC 559-6) TaxID=578456 RepID=UPI0003F49FCC|nr:uncharacterized protein TREMEDRAFT_59400 [Tremella mesenterica DSM 1558]EIW73233.1 hypothetical protein TREMEDRAFT_59400 [Tremella mesenterica DSM 1558]
MTSRSELDAYRVFVERFTSALSQQGNSPRQVSSMGLGALTITDGSPFVAAPPDAGASAAAPSSAESPVVASTPLSSGQQEDRPAPVGPSQALGQSATVVEIDDDEEMVVVDSDEDMDDVVDGEETGGAGDDEEMGDVDDVAGPSRLPATPSAGPSRCTPRRASSAALRPSTPVAGPSRLPATPSAGPSRPARSRPTPVSTQEDSPLSLPPALGTQSRQPSVPPASGLSTPAPPVKTPPKSSKGKGKNKKAVQFEPAVVENENTQLPEEVPPPLDHPYISDDPRIPEEEKQLATFRSLIIGLTTQLHANRRDTAKLLEYCMKLVSGMNTLSRTMATLLESPESS